MAFQGGGVKGIAYIGAYSALIEGYKENYNLEVEQEISSLIGSSAGGILALAFCCNLPPEELEEICTELGQIPLNDKTKNAEKQSSQRIYQSRVESIKSFLLEYGILGEDVIEEIELLLENRECEEALIDVLETVLDKNVLQLLMVEQNGVKSLNFCRLLSAGLMEGEAIRKIAKKCLKKVFPKYDDEQLEQVTMRDLYE